MKILKTILLVGVLGISRVGLGQGHEGGGLPGYERYEQGDLSKSVKLFPNPAVEYLSVKLEAPHAKQLKVALHSIIGNTVEVETETVDDHEIRIRVKDLPAGYYLLALKDDASNFKGTYKFLKR